VKFVIDCPAVHRTGSKLPAAPHFIAPAVHPINKHVIGRIRAATMHEHTHPMFEAEPARQLMLALLRGEQDCERISEESWADLLQFAIHEGLSGILARRLRELELAAPDSFNDRLRTAASQVSAANLHALRATEELSLEFNRAVSPSCCSKASRCCERSTTILDCDPSATWIS